MPASTRVLVTLPVSMHEALKARAVADSTTTSALIRQAVRDMLRQHHTPAKPVDPRLDELEFSDE